MTPPDRTYSSGGSVLTGAAVFPNGSYPYEVQSQPQFVFFAVLHHYR